MAKVKLRDNFDFGGDTGKAIVPTAEPLASQGPGRFRERGHIQAREAQLHEIDLIRRTAGLSVLEDPAKITAIVEAMDAIREQTGKILRSGVQIGREMIALLECLSADEGQKVVRAGSELFAGWTAGNLTKMIGAARLFDSGWIDKTLLPTSYTVLYQLSQIDRPLLEHAVERDLIHPDLSRTEVEELRRTITIVADRADDINDVSPELTQIDRRLAELRKELRNLRLRRSKLMGKLRRASQRAERTK